MEKLQEANCWLEFLVHWKVRLFHFPPRVPFCAFPLRLSQPSTTSAVRDIPAADSSSVSFECACFLMPCFLMPCFLYALLPVCPASCMPCFLYVLPRTQSTAASPAALHQGRRRWF